MPVRRLYMDNAATSFPKPRGVLEAMTRFATECGASAGRGGYAEAVESGRMLAEVRQRLCTMFNGGDARQFIFTSNCTDGLNLAIKGLVEPGGTGHAICTCTDHNSILRPLGTMEDHGWLAVTRVRIDPRDGLVDPAEIERAIRPDTRLIAITHASNVTGSLQPLAVIARIARQHDVPLVVDAAQSAGHVEIDVRAMEIDLLAAPGHKALLGPLGTGFLYIRPGLEKRLRPLKEGGTGSMSEQDRQPDFLPDRFEPGSHNAIGLAGLGEGLSWVMERTVAELAEHEKNLMRTFVDGIGDIEGLRYFGPAGVRDRVGVFSVRIDGLAPADLSAILERDYGILTRSGIHCAPLAHRAIGTADTGGTTRLSFGAFLSVQDVQYAADALADVATRHGIGSGKAETKFPAR
jgi:cysteine desulfurase family protein